jgi:prepilin-type N-terminal cleavage/methylation domain-containing protein
MKTPNLACRGFTLIEVLIAVGVISLLASAGFSTVANVRDSASENKLGQDVATLNNAVMMYKASGGTLPAGATAEQVLQLLKLPATTTTAQGKVGISGSFIDPRTSIDAATTADSRKMKAKWDTAAGRFVMKANDASYSIKSFNMKGASAGGTRSESAPVLVASDVTSGPAKWVWSYDDQVNTGGDERGNPTTPDISPGMADALSHGFTGGVLKPTTGTVSSNYVYDGAGYQGQLGLFSLDGMGADVYDLQTAAGLEAFIREAVRRVLAGGSQGQVMVDTSNGTGTTRTAQFTPGDAVAAILIPNGTFSQANFTDDGSDKYPLLSLSFPNGDQDGFYASQMVSLGNDGFAFEDLAGGGDQDYEDIIFTANGLEQPDWSTTNSVDPNTYYTEVRPNANWDAPNTTNGSYSPFSIKDALTAAGIID